MSPPSLHRSGFVALACAASCMRAATALAHEGAAEPPVFEGAPCIEVVDKREREALDVAYVVPVDDTELGYGDIRVTDAKTHQFFALRGALFSRGYEFGPEDHALHLYDLLGSEPLPVPLWLTRQDVLRAAEAASDEDGTGFTQADVDDAELLESQGALEARVLRVTGDDARVPITHAQSLRGVRWPLASVPVGLYTFAAYIFSPPYNGWAPRFGLVKVVQDGAGPAAAVLEPIAESLFAHEGRRVRGCLDVPPGTRMRGLLRLEEQPERGWVAWLPERTVESGPLELCFRTDADLTGSVRLRLELTTEAGEITVFDSPDTLGLSAGSGECAPSPWVCCDERLPLARPPAADPAPAPGATPDATAGPEAPAPPSSSGCAVARLSRPEGSSHVSWLVLCGLVFALVRRCRRAPRLSLRARPK